MNDQTTSVSLLAVTSSVGMFTSFLPPLSDVRKTVGEPDVANDVRLGEAAAAALAIAIGLMASSMTGSPVPAMLAIVCVGSLVIMYESILRSTPKEKVSR